MTRRSVKILISAFFAVCSIGCGSGSTTLSPLGPTSRCGVTLAASPSTIESAGGSGVLKVDTARECRWTLSSTASWIRFGAAVEGQGPADVSFTIEPNRSTDGRQVELSVAESKAAISQRAAVCVWKVTPETASVGATGGDLRATLTTEDFCTWTLASRVAWIDVMSALSGSGSAEISLHVDGNSGAGRSGSVEFPSGTIRIEQQEAPKPAPSPVPVPSPAPAPVPCAFAVTPNKFDNVSTAASDISVDVSTTAGCAWTATSSASWITLKSPAGTGSAKVTLSVAANTGDQRTGSVIVAGRTISVTQNAAPCTYSVTPGSFHVSSSAQTSQITVTTRSSCKVGVTSTASWLHVGTYASTGGGKIPLTIDQNGSTSKRSASLNLTGDSGFAKAVPVDQDGR